MMMMMIIFKPFSLIAASRTWGNLPAKSENGQCARIGGNVSRMFHGLQGLPFFTKKKRTETQSTGKNRKSGH